MKKLLCRMLANAPACHISTDDAEWRRASVLTNEADTTERIIWTLMHQFNSAVEPQASTYERISRLHDKALARSKRRSEAESIAMYRAMKRRPDQVDPRHVHYAAIVSALQVEEVTE